MHVLRRMIDGVRSGGIALDLQVIRPNPRAESEHLVICDIDGEPLFAKADAAAAAVQTLIAAGELTEEAVDDHDVLKHYSSGTDLLDDWERSGRRPLGDGAARLREMRRPCISREHSRLRRLRVRGD